MSTVDEYEQPPDYYVGPTEFPPMCAQLNDSEPETGMPNLLKTLANVQYLHENQIIAWPNWTQCLPNCGLCTSFPSDHIYLTYNLIAIGILLPLISLGGFVGNGLSSFIYSRPGRWRP